MATSNNVQAPDEEAAEWVAMPDGTFQQGGTPAGSQQNLGGLVKIFDGPVMWKPVVVDDITCPSNILSDHFRF